MAIILDAGEISVKTFRGYLEKAMFTALAKAMPQEQFLYPSEIEEIIDLPDNMIAVDFPARQSLFYQKKMDKWLREKGASAFISFTRTFKTTVPLKQLLLIATEVDLNNYKGIAAATAVGIISAGLYKKFAEKHPAYVNKGFLLHGILENVEPTANAPGIKSELTGDREYFLTADFNLNKNQLVTLLKGFSAFKKMQQSNWKFVIVLRSQGNMEKREAENLLLNYKYREDVVLTGIAGLKEKIAEAYALVSICVDEQFPVPVAEAITLKTPAIAVKTFTVNQLFGDAVVYTKNADSEAIGEMLMMMYKGETFRKNLIKKIEAGQFEYNVTDTIKTLKQKLL